MSKTIPIRHFVLRAPRPEGFFPTTVTLSPARRRALLDLAQQHRFAIIEDDYDHEIHFDGRPILPLASADG